MGAAPGGLIKPAPVDLDPLDRHGEASVGVVEDAGNNGGHGLLWLTL